MGGVFAGKGVSRQVHHEVAGLAAAPQRFDDLNFERPAQGGFKDSLVSVPRPLAVNVSSLHSSE